MNVFYEGKAPGWHRVGQAVRTPLFILLSVFLSSLWFVSPAHAQKPKISHRAAAPVVRYGLIDSAHVDSRLIERRKMFDYSASMLESANVPVKFHAEMRPISASGALGGSCGTPSTTVTTMN